MGQHLGDFGTVRDLAPAEVATFGYFGGSYRTHPELVDDFAMADLGELLVSVDTMDGLAQLAAVKRLLRGLVHPEDFEKVWEAGRANRQTFDDLGDLAKALFVAVSGRPTERPADSSGGPGPTPPSSAVGSSLRVQHRLERHGRPDLALVVQEVREYREAASA